MPKISKLHNWLEQLSEDVQARVRSYMKVATVENGQKIYSQGDEALNLYQIVKGRVKVSNYSAQGKEQLYSILRESDCFGEMGLIDGEPRLNHTIAVGQVELRVLSLKNFKQLYDDYPEIPKKINLMLCRRLHLVLEGIDALTLLKLRERLALALIRLADSKSDLLNTGDFNVVDIPQEELGKMLNATRQSIGKELKFFDSKGLLEIKYGKIMNVHVTALNEEYGLLIGGKTMTVDYDD